MELINQQISKKLAKSPSMLYQTQRKSDDYPFDPQVFWLTPLQFEALQTEYPHFSIEMLISSLLFCKSRKPDRDKWFKAKFFGLFKGYLVQYSKKDLERPKRVLILKGVHLRQISGFFSEKELKKLSNEGILDPTGFILSRNGLFELFSPGTSTLHHRWLSLLAPCCILHRFKYCYKPLTQLSSTSNSQIQEAISLITKETVILKLFDKKLLEKSQKEGLLTPEKLKKVFFAIENEVNVLRRLENSYLVALLEVYETKAHIILVFEHLKAGDLYQRVLSGSGFVEQEIKDLVRQIAQGLAYLHSKGIMHRDLKIENLLFESLEPIRVKIGDFGLAEYAGKTEYLFRRCGTPGYVAPEVLEGGKYDWRCDLFSLGVVLFVL